MAMMQGQPRGQTPFSSLNQSANRLRMLADQRAKYNAIMMRKAEERQRQYSMEMQRRYEAANKSKPWWQKGIMGMVGGAIAGIPAGPVGMAVGAGLGGTAGASGMGGETGLGGIVPALGMAGVGMAQGGMANWGFGPRGPVHPGFGWNQTGPGTWHRSA